jgi:hypothetical protein
MIGGAFPFSKTDNFHIIINMSNPIKDSYNKLRKEFNIKELDNYHLTLLTIQLDGKCKYTKIFQNKKFHDIITIIFKHLIINKNLIIKSNNDYDLFSNVLVQKYYLDNYHCIKRFRYYFYYILNIYFKNKLISRKERITNPNDPNDIEDFIIYEYNNEKIYAVSQNKYYGVSTWRPHISILNIRDLKISEQNDLQNMDKTQKIKFLTRNISSNNNININDSFESLNITINDLRNKTRIETVYTRDKFF